MELKRLLGAAGVAHDAALELPTTEVTSVTEDSRTAGRGTLFVAIQGTRADGAGYARDAVARGACAVLAATAPPEGWPEDVPWVRIDDPRRGLARVAATLFDHPGRKLALTAVTGSKGKTTTACLLASICDTVGEPSALLTTVAYRVGSMERRAGLTTPSAPMVHGVLAEAVDAGMKGAIIEASSHALDQDRLFGLDFAAGVFTNLFPDHLDYHETIDAYFEAKRRLFVGPGACERAVIGIDGRHGKRLAAELDHPITFGSSAEADVRPLLLEPSRNGIRLLAQVPGSTQVAVDSPLVGRHNAGNLLAAIAYGVARGFDLDAVRAGIQAMEAAPGRMEPIDLGQPFTCLVDFSHMGAALEAVLNSVREWTSGRVLVLFGCGGNKDPERRRTMGDAAARLADFTFLTSDNPRDERPEAILADIERAFRAAGGSAYASIVDRHEAIEAAVGACQPGDTLVIAGRGHEREQLIGAERIPFDDREEVRKALAGRGYV